MSDTPIQIQAQKFLGGIDYPATKEDIVRTARDAGADENVLSALEAIADRDYEDPTEVSKAISG